MRHALLALVICSSPAVAQADLVGRPPTIIVTGTGKVSTPPEVATIEYSLAGEGKTADDASRDLVATRKAIVEQLTTVLGGQATVTDSNLVIMPVRSSACQDASGYNAQPRLSQGECAVIGYLATSQGTIRTSQVAKAGTAVGLASRLGARDARIQSFEIADVNAAEHAALAQAVVDAAKQAQAIATAAGRKLGPVISIRDQASGYSDVVVSGSRSFGSLPPAPPPPPPPVEIGLSPRPIETVARIDVVYSLLP